MLEVLCATFMCSSICARMWYSNTTVSSWPNLVAYQQTCFLSNNLRKHHYYQINHISSDLISPQIHIYWTARTLGPFQLGSPPTSWPARSRGGPPEALQARRGAVQRRSPNQRPACCWEIMAYSQWLKHWMKVYYLYSIMVYMVMFQLGLQKLNGYHLYVHVLFHCSFLRWYQTMYQ